MEAPFGREILPLAVKLAVLALVCVATVKPESTPFTNIFFPVTDTFWPPRIGAVESVMLVLLTISAPLNAAAKDGVSTRSKESLLNVTLDVPIMLAVEVTLGV